MKTCVPPNKNFVKIWVKVNKFDLEGLKILAKINFPNCEKLRISPKKFYKSIFRL
jgi:hypothetical protein